AAASILPSAEKARACTAAGNRSPWKAAPKPDLASATSRPGAVREAPGQRRPRLRRLTRRRPVRVGERLGGRIPDHPGRAARRRPPGGTGGGGGSGCSASCCWLWTAGGGRWPGPGEGPLSQPQASQGGKPPLQRLQHDGGDERGVSPPGLYFASRRETG